MYHFPRISRASCGVGLATALILGGCTTGKSSKHLIAGKTAISDSKRLAEFDSPPQAQPQVQTVAYAQQGQPTDTSIATPAETGQTEKSAAGSVVRPAEPTSNLTPTGQAPENSTSLNDLDSFIAMALANNPAIRQAEAAVAKAAGYRNQVTLKPNPMFGYNGAQLFDRQTDQHTLYVSQDFVRGDKLARNGNVLDHEVENLKWQVEQQRRSVTSDVKQSFYKVLGSQTQLELAKTFCQMAEQAVDLTKKRAMAGEGTELDVLQAEIQLEQLVINRNQTRATLQGAWKQLSALIGAMDTEFLPVKGELPLNADARNWEDELNRILAESPEIHAANSRICRAMANLSRQQVQSIPNVSMMLAAGYDQVTRSQMVNTQVGLPLPVHNWNQGNQYAACAEYQRAVRELETTQASIRSRLGQAANAYQSAAATVEGHRTEVLPRAERLLKLSEQAYRAGEADFLQVLSIRQTYYNSQLTYVAGRTDLAQAQSLLDELLLSNSLNGVTDTTLDDGLRGQTLSGQ